MIIVFWIKGYRGVRCLESVLNAGYRIEAIVLQSQNDKKWYKEAIRIARENGIKLFEPDDPNDVSSETYLKSLKPDLFVLAGYGEILKRNIISIPSKLCINLHGGKLPDYRGSSPMNWCLINGEEKFGLSIIKVDEGVDTGPILLEAEFPITLNNTIKDLHEIANKEFPKMLMQALEMITTGEETFRDQQSYEGEYWPLRFPEDGFILFDQFSAVEIHNRIRALTDPYPCAFIYYNGRKVKLLKSEISVKIYHGEPGRIYKKTDRGLLVCAKDQCFWITEALFDDTGENFIKTPEKYERLSSITLYTLNSLGK